MVEPKTIKKSLADEILDFNDERTEIITVPEWGNKKVLCKSLTGDERARLIKIKELSSSDMIMFGAYNPETGEKLFSGAQREKLGKKNTAALERVALVIARLSGMSTTSAEETEKN